MNEQNTPGAEVTRVPTKEEREADRNWIATDQYCVWERISGNSRPQNMALKYIAALEHAVAERDALREENARLLEKLGDKAMKELTQ